VTVLQVLPWQKNSSLPNTIGDIATLGEMVCKLRITSMRLLRISTLTLEIHTLVADVISMDTENSKMFTTMISLPFTLQ
jgi:hypothetical protein